MFDDRRPSHATTTICLLVVHIAAAATAGDCTPHPVGLSLGNVTLGNTTRRGVSFSVGKPEQSFAFLPQWPLNHTFVYGTDGYCGDGTSTAGCRTFRGGLYDKSASKTSGGVSSNPYLSEASPYPDFTWGTDNLVLNSKTTLHDYRIGVPRADWGAQGYHPQAAFGLGQDSTILKALLEAGDIASRSWAMFWGRTGATESTQQPGNFVFGGYDRAKASGENHTDWLNYSHESCPTGMLVTVSDLVLGFPNGTSTSLFDGLRSSAMSVCIVPDYPVLMTLPRDPYFNKFEDLTGTRMISRSFGVYYYGMIYDHASDAYGGDLTIKVNSGFSVRIPNDQLVVPELTIDDSTGALHANGSTPELVINAMQMGNADDLPKLGRQFLSSAYLMVNQDAGSYTLWEANQDTNEDLVAIDKNNVPVTQFCAANDGTSSTAGAAATQHGTLKPTDVYSTSASSNDNATSGPSNDNGDLSPAQGSASGDGGGNSNLSNGALAGIVVGGVAAIAIVAGLVLFFCARKRKMRRNPPADPPEYYFPERELGEYNLKSRIPLELYGDPRYSSKIPELP